MPVASAISTHSVHVSHHSGAKGIGGRGHGRASGNGTESAPDFGEVLRGQAGVISQPGRSQAIAKQGVVPGSEQVAEKASGTGAEKGLGQTNGAAEASVAKQVQIVEAVNAKVAAKLDTPSAQLQALSKGGAQSAHAEDVQAAPLNATESKRLEKSEKDSSAQLSSPGADAGDGKAVKDKSGKDGKSDEADKIIAEKPPQVPVVALSSSAAAPVSVPFLPALQTKARSEYSAPPCAMKVTTPAAKSASGKQTQQAGKGTSGIAGEGQAKANGPGLPIPDASPSLEPATGLTGDAELEHLPGVKSSGKQDSSAIAAKTGSEIAPQTKHLNSPAPTAIHSAQAAQAAVAAPGENAAHISASPQNFAGMSNPAVGALHGASIGAASPYDRIDQGTAPVVLHTGAQQVAVGVHDPSLGWVEIKTQSVAGHVDATLVASSGQTHDALAAQLPAISQFLELRDVRVGTLVVNHQNVGNSANHFGNGSGQHAGPGYGGNGGSGGNGANSGGERRPPQYSAPIPARHSGPVAGAGGEGSSTARPLSYISVRA